MRARLFWALSSTLADPTLALARLMNFKMKRELEYTSESCTCGFHIQDVYHMIIECPRHTDEICNILKHTSDERKSKSEMLSNEKTIIKSIHLQNDYGITRLEQRKQIKATTKAWNRCIEKMEKLLGDTD